MKERLRMGMVGGGRGAFIGAVHRMAARLDDEIALTAGAFASDPRRSRLSGKDLGLDPRRVYGDFTEMVRAETRLPSNERIDFVSIVTPNHTHFSIARAFLRAGIPVFCDKPLTLTLRQATDLRALCQKSKTPLAVAYNYTGYPLVREARDRVARGELGAIQKIVVEYTQDWLLQPLERKGHKQAAWRTDPKRAGATGCLGDIGSHAEHLARFVTGMKPQQVAAEFTSFVKGRRLEDDASVLLRYQGGAKGVLLSSQVAAGEENNLHLRVYGTKASLEWRQEEPNHLVIKAAGGLRHVHARGQAQLGARAGKSTRLPAGHPEAFIEAFANLYRDFAAFLRARRTGRKPAAARFPDVNDGRAGMAFLEAAVASARANGRWTRIAE